MIKKISARPDDIISSLDPDVVKKAQAISVSDQYKKSLFQQPLEIKVGDYSVMLEAKGTEESPDIYLSCTCGYWRYQGPEYHAVRNNYLFGTLKGTAEKPEKRDPKGTHRLCKHAYAVLRDLFGVEK